MLCLKFVYSLMFTCIPLLEELATSLFSIRAFYNRNEIKHMLRDSCYIYVQVTSNLKVGTVCSYTVLVTIYRSTMYRFDNTENHSVTLHHC